MQNQHCDVHNDRGDLCDKQCDVHSQQGDAGDDEDEFRTDTPVCEDVLATRDGDGALSSDDFGHDKVQVRDNMALHQRTESCYGRSGCSSECRQRYHSRRAVSTPLDPGCQEKAQAACEATLCSAPRSLHSFTKAGSDLTGLFRRAALLYKDAQNNQPHFCLVTRI